MTSDPGYPDADHGEAGPVQAVTTVAACRKGGPNQTVTTTPRPHAGGATSSRPPGANSGCHGDTQPWPATSIEKARGIPDWIVYYQYRHDRARRTLRGIDEQVAKAEQAVEGHAPVKRNRFIKLTAAAKSVNRELEAKARG